MDNSEATTPLNDRLLTVYQLAAEECFPGVVVQERSGELRIKSLIRLPVEGDLPQFTDQQHFRIPEESLAIMKLGDYVTFSCDIPVHPQLNKRDIPFVEQLAKVEKPIAVQIKDGIQRKLKEHARNERLAEHRRQLESQVEERERKLAERELGLEQRITTLKSREESVRQREMDVQQKELHYKLLSRDEEGNKVVSSSLPASEFQFLYTVWPELLQSVGHISSRDRMAEQSLLLGLLSASISGELVILDGPVGVGKTSVVTRAAKVLTGTEDTFDLIPVRPGWIDSSDLLGFYNPNYKEYHPSPLLTALHRAGKHLERLRIICLDELNLARIENYGADLLACIEERNVRKLPLYSPDIAQSLRTELGFLQLENTSLTHADWLRINKIGLTLETFPAQFGIPDNAVFVGTLNSDETTYDISPKVIDRAFVIRLPIADISMPLAAENNTEQRLCILDLCDLRQSVEANLRAGADFSWLLEQIGLLQDLLRLLGIPLGYRTRRDLEILAAVSRTIGLEDKEVILEHFVFSKILPRVRCQKSERTGKAWQKFRTTFETTLGHDSMGIVKNLQRQWDDTTYYTVRYFDVIQ